MIDVTFITKGLRVTATPAPDSAGSDHRPIIISKPGRAPQKKCNANNWDEYRARLRGAATLGQSLTPELIAATLKASSRPVIVSCFRPNPDLKWLRLRARRRSWRRNLPQDILEYKRLDAKFRRNSKQLARWQWRLLCTSFGGPRGTGRAWRMAKALARTAAPTQAELYMAARLSLGEEEMAALLMDHFLTIPAPSALGPRPQSWSPIEHCRAPRIKLTDKSFPFNKLID